MTLQQAMNETDDSWPSRDARTLLRTTSAADNDDDLDNMAAAGLIGDRFKTGPVIVERLNKPRQASPCIRIMNDLPQVSGVLVYD